MKTLLKRILVLAVMFGTLTSYANDDLKVNSTFKSEKKGDRISVSDASGDIIYRGKINYSGEIETLYDFSKLKNGKYTVEINKAFEIIIHTIDVKNNTVTVVNADQKTIHKPFVRNENAIVLISKLAFNTERMTVALYFGDELIHAETLKGGKILNRVYKLDQTLPGKYTAIIKSDDRVFIENFRI